MAISGGLHIEFSDKREPIDIRFTISDPEADLLRSFLDDTKALLKFLDSIGGFNISHSFSYSEGNKASIVNTEPSDDQRAVILHRLRPLPRRDGQNRYGQGIL